MNEFSEPAGAGIEIADIPGRAAHDIWTRSLEILRTRVNSQSFKAWFEPILPLSFDGRQLRVQVPSQFFQEWLEEHHYSLITEVLAQITRSEVSLDYLVKTEERDTSAPAPAAAAALAPARPAEAFSPPRPKPKTESFLNPRYTFDNYIKGESNQFARAAAIAVANNPGGTSFNPLVVY